MTDRTWRRAFAFAAVAWCVALMAALVLASRPRLGSAAYLLSASIYSVGSVICHQRPERSFHLLGAQLPVCARCTGIYAGAAAAAFVAALRYADAGSRQMSRPAVALAISAVPSALTLIYEFTTAQLPGNWARAAAGFPLGAVIAWIISRAGTSRAAVGIH